MAGLSTNCRGLFPLIANMGLWDTLSTTTTGCTQYRNHTSVDYKGKLEASLWSTAVSTKLFDGWPCYKPTCNVK